MKKVIAILFASLLMNGAAFADPGPVRSSNCKDIIEGIKKKAANQQPGAQPGQPGAGQPAGDAR